MAFFDDKAPWFMGKLISDFALDVLDAAAIIGNAGHESGGFLSLQEKKPLVPGSKGGYGIMQWTGPRRRNYEAYCARNSLEPSSMDTNYKFLFVELNGPEGSVLPKLRAAKTLDQKTEIFMDGFLRPGIPHLAERQKWALRALQAYQKAPVQPEVSNTQPIDHAPVEAPVARMTLWDWIVLILRIFKRS